MHSAIPRPISTTESHSFYSNMLLCCHLRQRSPRCSKRVTQQALPHRNLSRVLRWRWVLLPRWRKPIPFPDGPARHCVFRLGRDCGVSSSRQHDGQAAPCWFSALVLLAVRQESAYLFMVSPRRFLAIAGRVTNSAKPLPVQHTGPAAISLAGLFRLCSRRPAPPYHVAI